MGMLIGVLITLRKHNHMIIKATYFFIVNLISTIAHTNTRNSNRIFLQERQP
jgi:hypothetical protein